MYALIIVIIVCVVSAGVVISIVVFRSSGPVDAVRDRIMHDLSNNGYQMIDIKTTGPFSKGPHASGNKRFQVMRPLKGSGRERTKYRIVRYKDNKGMIRQSWIRIHSTAMEKEKVTWLPEI